MKRTIGCGNPVQCKWHWGLSSLIHESIYIQQRDLAANRCRAAADFLFPSKIQLGHGVAPHFSYYQAWATVAEQSLREADAQGWADKTAKGIAAIDYEIHFESGSMLTGALDQAGKARHENVLNKPVKKIVYKSMSLAKTSQSCL